MIDRELVTSEKYLSLTWVGRALYPLLYATTNRDGRVDGNLRMLWAKTGCAALLDLEPFGEEVNRMVAVGLLITRETDDGRKCLEFFKFWDHQGFIYATEPVGEWTFNDAERVPQVGQGQSRDSGGRFRSRPVVGTDHGTDHGTGSTLRTVSATGREHEREREREREDEEVRPSSSSLWTSEDVDREEVRVRQAWIRNLPEKDLANGVGLSYADRKAIRDVAENRRCVGFPTDEAIDKRIREVRAEFEAKGLTCSARGILNNLPYREQPTARILPGPGLSPELQRDREESERQKAQTRALIDSMATEEEREAAYRRGPARNPPGRTISPPADPEPVPEGERKLGPLAGAATAFLEKLEARVEKARERVAEDAAGTVPIDPVERVVRGMARRAGP